MNVGVFRQLYLFIDVLNALQLSEKWIWTILYQLCKWKTAADLHWTDTKSWAGEMSTVPIVIKEVLTLSLPETSFKWIIVSVTFKSQDYTCNELHTLTNKLIVVIPCRRSMLKKGLTGAQLIILTTKLFVM